MGHAVLAAVPSEALSAYLANPAFRSAEGHELILEHNAFHRPVRPQDLRMLTFASPLQADRVFELSALMTQRMLCNINEADCTFVGAPGPARQQEADRAAFYDADTRWRGEALRPFLEHYAFGWLFKGESVLTAGAAISATCAALIGSGGLAGQLQGCRDPQRAARMLLIQLSGPLFSERLAFARQLGIIDWSGRLGPLRAVLANAAVARIDASMVLLGRGGLLARPHAYWQFYLGSWLAVANLAHRLVRQHQKPWCAIGAQVYDELWSDAQGRALARVLPDTLGVSGESGQRRGAEALADRALSALRGDAEAEVDFVTGFEAMRTLYAAAERDWALQLEWSDDIERQRELAIEYGDLIAAAPFQVDMETYVEPSSERSTTHVHDTDRLLVIESGEMDFWPSFGSALHLRAGDRLFVPRHRLHGSVVTSDECRYHQPIIDARVVALRAARA